MTDISKRTDIAHIDDAFRRQTLKQQRNDGMTEEGRLERRAWLVAAITWGMAGENSDPYQFCNTQDEYFDLLVEVADALNDAITAFDSPDVDLYLTVDAMVSRVVNFKDRRGEPDWPGRYELVTLAKESVRE